MRLVFGAWSSLTTGLAGQGRLAFVIRCGHESKARRFFFARTEVFNASEQAVRFGRNRSYDNRVKPCAISGLKHANLNHLRLAAGPIAGDDFDIV
jgi:hypothetical protein